MNGMIDLKKAGKQSLSINSPVVISSGTAGFGDTYRGLVKLEKLGALVTNPLTFRAWSPARGTRVVPLEAGVLIHTGLPNPGVERALKEYGRLWLNMPIPVIVHLVATSRSDVKQAVEMLSHAESVAGIELGLADDISAEQAAELTQLAVNHSEKPVMVRLPMNDAYEIAEPVEAIRRDARGRAPVVAVLVREPVELVVHGAELGALAAAAGADQQELVVLVGEELDVLADQVR